MGALTWGVRTHSEVRFEIRHCAISGDLGSVSTLAYQGRRPLCRFCMDLRTGFAIEEEVRTGAGYSLAHGQ